MGKVKTSSPKLTKSTFHYLLILNHSNKFIKTKTINSPNKLYITKNKYVTRYIPQALMLCGSS